MDNLQATIHLKRGRIKNNRPVEVKLINKTAANITIDIENIKSLIRRQRILP